MRGIFLHQYSYLLLLILSISGLLLADWRYKIAFWNKPRSTIKTILASAVLLLVFDVVGLINGIFYTNQRFVVKVYLFTPNLPIEELVFLFLLSYFTLIVFLTLNRFITKSHTKKI